MEIIRVIILVVFVASLISIYKNAKWYIKKNMIELDEGDKDPSDK